MAARAWRLETTEFATMQTPSQSRFFFDQFTVVRSNRCDFHPVESSVKRSAPMPPRARSTTAWDEMLSCRSSSALRSPFFTRVQSGIALETAHSGQLADGEVPPPRCDPQRFRPIAPFSRDPGMWQAQRWVDAYSGTPLAVTTRHSGHGTHVIRLKTIGDIVGAYERHPEAKSLGPDGRPCVATTRGLLRPRTVHAEEVIALGKDTHRFESVLSGQEAEWEDVQLAYPRTTRPSLDQSLQRFLNTLTTEAAVQAFAAQAGVDGRTIYRMKKGCSVGQRSLDAVAESTELLRTHS